MGRQTFRAGLWRGGLNLSNIEALNSSQFLEKESWLGLHKPPAHLPGGTHQWTLPPDDMSQELSPQGDGICRQATTTEVANTLSLSLTHTHTHTHTHAETEKHVRQGSSETIEF